MRKEVKNWIDSAGYDLETAEAMFNTGRYIYTVFMCHLALEKMLKAKVEEITGKMPPKTHDLQWLIQLAKLSPPEDKQNFIGKINVASVVTRYPDDLARMQKDFPKDDTEQLLHQTQEVFQWIKTFIKP